MPTRIEIDAPVEQLYQLALREGNSKKPVYELHKWWARRFGSVFRMLLLLATGSAEQTDDEIWKRFYNGDDLSSLRLLDPFMGGGTSIVEATKLRCETVGIDIDPVAWFVTRQELKACDLDLLQAAIVELAASDVVAQIRTFYQTTVPRRLSDGTYSITETVEADVIYNFWVDRLTCPSCNTIFDATTHYRLLYHDQKPQQTVFCHTCSHPATVPRTDENYLCEHCAETTYVASGTVQNGRYTCPSCQHQGRVVDLPNYGEPLPKRWFAIEYLEPETNRRLFKTPDTDDIVRLQQAEQLFETERLGLPLPTRIIPLEGRNDPRPTTHGYARYEQLFNKRQLLALGWICRWIQTHTDISVRDFCMLAFSDALAANNLLCSFAYGYDKLTPLFGLHAYNMITRPVENNVWGTMFGRGSVLSCLKKVVEGKKYCVHPYESRYQSSGKLEKVFIDTPVIADIVQTSDEWYVQKEEDSYPRCLLLNQSSEILAPLRDSTINIILSDPPYYNNLSYSELSDFYYAWLRPYLAQIGATWAEEATPYNNALFVKQRIDVQQSVVSFTDRLCSAFRECARVLCHDGLMIFTFHHLDAFAWIPLTYALRSAGLHVTKVFPVRSEGRGQFHSTEGSAKWDAVIVCRKNTEHQARLDESLTNICDRTMLDQIVVSTSEGVQYWQERLAQAEIPFEWPDQLSLSFAFLMQWLTTCRPSHYHQLDIPSVYHAVSKRVIERLPESAQQRIRRRKRHKVTSQHIA